MFSGFKFVSLSGKTVLPLDCAHESSAVDSVSDIGLLIQCSKIASMTSKFSTLIAALTIIAAGTTFAQTPEIDIKNAWVRTTVPGQSATGAFLTIIHKNGAKLVRAASPAAGVTEIHEMKMDGDVMRMRALPQGLDLPAGKAVALAPGGHHIMLMDLKAALPKDAVVPITLWFKDDKGVETQLELKLTVATTAPGGKAGEPDKAATEHKH